VTSLDALAASLADSRLITDPDVMEAYRRDEAHLVPADMNAIRELAAPDQYAVVEAGDGNAHPTFVFDRQPDGDAPPRVWSAADDIFRAALDLGGTLTGEHGVGTLKRRWLALELGDTALDVHRSIKHALDPNGIMNPGKAF
jgi:FAD/FMN-containing dehydrogenase